VAAEAQLGMNEQPIHDAARLGTRQEVEKILKATPQARDARTPLGITPLHYAAMNEDSGPLQALLAAGAPVNARDGEGRTPLHMAAFSTRTANGKLLLQAGADPDAKTDAGRDVLSMARKVRADELAGDRVAVDTQGLPAGQAVLKAARRPAARHLRAVRPWPRTKPDLPPVTVYAPSPCLACIDWADHLRKAGFEVSIEETPLAGMPKLKRWLNVPAGLESVHTAKVGNYFIEGHVPAEDIKLLLKEKPQGARPGRARTAARRAGARTVEPLLRNRLHHPRQRQPGARSTARGLQHPAGRAGRQDQRVR
jgi:hypothetical protein